MQFNRYSKLHAITLFFLAATIVGIPIAAAQTTQTATGFGDVEGTRQTADAAETENGKPYRITSQFHVFKGTDKGYLVVQVDMVKGKHIYSLTQNGVLKPSKIRVAASDQFRLTGSFSPDRKPIVIEHDPVLDQRIEKHEGSVRFLAKVEINPGVDISELGAEIFFDGLICSERGCMPINNVKARAKFAGYIQPPIANLPNQRNAANAVGDSNHR